MEGQSFAELPCKYIPKNFQTAIFRPLSLFELLPELLASPNPSIPGPGSYTTRDTVNPKLSQPASVEFNAIFLLLTPICGI